MMRATIIEKFTTSLGTIIKTQNDNIYSVGSVIETTEGKYKVIGIVMPTKPIESNFTFLKVLKEN